jgi:hypothetical protein
MIKRKFMNQRSGVLAAIGLCCITSLAMAAEPSGVDAVGAPSPIAIQACEGEDVGAAVEYSLKGGRVFEGSCTMINGRLVALPVTKVQTLKADDPSPDLSASKPQT